LLPRWLVWFGIFVAAAGELSTLSLVSYAANFAIPIARFGGFIWLVAVAAKLPKTPRTESNAIDAVREVTQLWRRRKSG
jgi:hypothetical protein